MHHQQKIIQGISSGKLDVFQHTSVNAFLWHCLRITQLMLGFYSYNVYLQTETYHALLYATASMVSFQHLHSARKVAEVCTMDIVLASVLVELFIFDYTIFIMIFETR